jgi:succinate dehydrogenase / fumarate reductase iron-sulfur subunit
MVFFQKINIFFLRNFFAIIFNNFFTIFMKNFNFKVVDVYRYDSKKQKKPYVVSYLLSADTESGSMVLDVLFYIKKNYDSSISFRRSCREGICGSCAMNVNGVNTLACLQQIDVFKKNCVIMPLPHAKIRKDLVPDLSQFFKHYKSIQPWLKSEKTDFSNKELLQTISAREKIDGLYECVLCACCSTSCPSYWWNETKYLGPAILLQAYRWIVDSRDKTSADRLENLNDVYKLYRCHSIMNCSKICPKHLNPGKAIAGIKSLVSSLLLNFSS